MTQNDASTLLKKFSEPYLLPYRSELPEMDAMRWIKLFMGLSIRYKAAGVILTEYLSNNPPRYKDDGLAFGVMPDIEQVGDFLLRRINVREPCPCCDNSTWIYNTRDEVTRCDCVKGKIDICKNRKYCNPYSRDKDNALFNIPCPFGEEYWKNKSTN